MKNLLILLLVGFTLPALSQTGIGTTTPDPSAMLDVSSNDKGLLPPRMTEAERDAISSPADGLVIYQTDGTVGLYVRSSSAWVKLGITNESSSSGSAPSIPIVINANSVANNYDYGDMIYNVDNNTISVLLHGIDQNNYQYFFTTQPNCSSSSTTTNEEYYMSFQVSDTIKVVNSFQVVHYSSCTQDGYEPRFYRSDSIINFDPNNHGWKSNSIARNGILIPGYTYIVEWEVFMSNSNLRDNYKIGNISSFTVNSIFSNIYFFKNVYLTSAYVSTTKFPLSTTNSSSVNINLGGFGFSIPVKAWVPLN